MLHHMKSKLNKMQRSYVNDLKAKGSKRHKSVSIEHGKGKFFFSSYSSVIFHYTKKGVLSTTMVRVTNTKKEKRKV